MMNQVVTDRRVAVVALVISLTTLLAAGGADHRWVMLGHGLTAFAVASVLVSLRDRGRAWIALALSPAIWGITQFLRAANLPWFWAILAGAVTASVIGWFAHAAVEARPAREQIPWIAVDGAVLAFAVFAIQWFLVLESDFTGAHQHAVHRASDTALAWISLLTVIPLALLGTLLIHLGRPRVPRVLFVIGIIPMAIFSNGWAHGWNNPVLDIASSIGLLLLLIGWMALPGDRAPVRLVDRELQLSWPSPVQLIPTLTGAIALGTAFGHSVQSTWHPIDMIIAAVVGISLVARQVLYFVEERRLFSLVMAQHQQLRHQAMHDPLTSLANRDLFYDRLYHALVMRRRAASPLALIYLDIDGFSAINERYGHGTGDALLVAFADRLSMWVRPADTVARLGADEFAIIIDGSQDAAMVVAERLVDEIGRGFELSGRQISVHASIGVAALERPTDDGTADAADLINRADRAMHDAKRERSGITSLRADSTLRQ